MIANTAKWEKYDTFPDHDFQIIRKTMAAADIFLLGSQHTRAVNQPSRSFTVPGEGRRPLPGHFPCSKHFHNQESTLRHFDKQAFKNGM